MQRALSFLFFLPVLSFPILAQDGFPRYEIFGGSSLISSPVGFQRDVFNGWSAEFSTYFRKEIGATVSISRQYGNVMPLGCFEPRFSRFYATYAPKVCTEGIGVGLRQTLAGPRFTWRKKGITTFGDFLYGRSTASYEQGKHFTMGYGGGVDLRVNDRFSLRPFQFTYIPSRAPDSGFLWRHSFRYQTGVVFNFGGWRK